MDLLGLPRTPYAPINIHVNTTQGGKENAMKRFCVNFERLDASVKTRLVVENDDSTTAISVPRVVAVVERDALAARCNYHEGCHSASLDPE